MGNRIIGQLSPDRQTMNLKTSKTEICLFPHDLVSK